jgi:hypothetical protein
MDFLIARLWTWAFLALRLVKILGRDFFVAGNSLLIFLGAELGARLCPRVLDLSEPTVGIRKFIFRVRLRFRGALVEGCQILDTEHCFFIILNFWFLWSGLKRVVSFDKWVVNILKRELFCVGLCRRS